MMWLLIAGLVIVEAVTLLAWWRARDLGRRLQVMLDATTESQARRNPLGKRVKVSAVKAEANAVRADGVVVYSVRLSCGCSFPLFSPPDDPPTIGTLACCYSVDGSHLVTP